MRYKYSKSLDFYLKTKKNFFTQNDSWLKKTLEVNHLYSAQKKRRNCKICNTKLSDTLDFTSHNVGYVFCSFCTHLNGKFEDTKEFAKKLYISDDGKNYSANYLDKDFNRRTMEIYMAKIDFLINNIPKKKMKILDVGCGIGYLVYASLLRNIDATGIDVSKTMIELGNNQISKHINKNPLIHTNENFFYEAVLKSNSNIISAIGVIEHLREPNSFFQAFKYSKAQYLYYSIPMFSFSTMLESISKDIFPRQLSGGHTHLFTETSIKKMNKIIGVKAIAEWRFGVDAMDLYRHMFVKIKKKKYSQKFTNYLDLFLGKNINKIQSIFDKNNSCSEIHCIVSKK
jgi:SAM-dependent methyltransferase